MPWRYIIAASIGALLGFAGYLIYFPTGARAFLEVLWNGNLDTQLAHSFPVEQVPKAHQLICQEVLLGFLLYDAEIALRTAAVAGMAAALSLRVADYFRPALKEHQEPSAR